MSLSLSTLANAISGKLSDTVSDLTILNLSSNADSNLKQGVFIALRGTARDGHNFVEQAFRNGAVAAIVSDRSVLKGRPGIIVENTNKIAGSAASLVYGNAQGELRLVGITGTNGKTTTNWIIYHLWKLLGFKSARIGTLGFESEKSSGDFGLTTPDAITLHRLLAQFKSEGVTHVVLEVSSHALSQGRVDGLHFDAAIFTNLTQDHLDYHRDMQEYFEAKWNLFERLQSSSKSAKLSVINSDSTYGEEILTRLKGRKFLDYGTKDSAVLCISNFEQSISGSRFHLKSGFGSFEIESPYIGEHNAENLVAALGVVCGLGADPQQTVSKIHELPQVPGRLQLLKLSEDAEPRFGVFVDYAHTPDALENVLLALRPLTKGKLSVIFGCGGDRDKGKRPLMRGVATKLSDAVIVTSDNPRTEDAHAIIKDIMAGADAIEGSKSVVIPNRAEAIVTAISGLKSGDVLLIAGKGHEEYQIIGTEKRHFSDVEEGLKALKITNAL